MLRDVLEIIGSGVMIFVVGYLIWPPGYFYWDAVSDVAGGSITFLIITGICVGFGIVVRRSTPLPPVNFAVGGLIAYLVGMNLVEATMEPGSPVHLFVYGFTLICTIIGHATREILDFIVDSVGSRLYPSARG